MTLFLFCFGYYLLGGIVSALVYHRCLTHRSFRLKKWFEHTLVIIGLPAGSPIQWVGNHRFHHMHTDTNQDPHSPIVSGFWYAHCGWYIQSKNPLWCALYALAGPIRFLIDAFMRPRTNQQYTHLAPDIAADPFYVKISYPLVYGIILFLHALVPFTVVYIYWGIKGVIALWFTLLIIFNLGDGVNSMAHGYKNAFGTTNLARNSRFWSLLTLGDGLHGNHHQYPTLAKLSLKANELDLGWYIILLFNKLGLAYSLKTEVPQPLKQSE